MNRHSKTPGICRIDQPSHRTHGFFVRVHFRGKTFSAFFSDLKHGGKEAALARAQKHWVRMRKKLGLPGVASRRWNAQVVRRRGRSGIHGVQRIILRHVSRRMLKYWTAHFSPRPGVYRKKMFSIRKYGEERARRMAIRARKEGLKNMK